jgi:beta-lactamase class A
MHQLENLVAACTPARVAVAVQGLGSGPEILLHADEPFPPASTFKVAVMAEVFDQAERGLLSLDDRIPISNSFRSAADGEPYSLQSEDDADPSLYAEIGREESLRELVRRMIVRSSNLATNLLIGKIGLETINALLQESGITGISMIRGLFDRRAHALGMDNSTTARGLTQLMSLLAGDRLVSEPASREMIRIMLGQEFSEGIPAGLDPKIRVAHKTGWDDEIYHDSGIVLPADGRPYALTVLTQGFQKETEAHACVANISRLAYEALR